MKLDTIAASLEVVADEIDAGRIDATLAQALRNYAAVIRGTSAHRLTVAVRHLLVCSEGSAERCEVCREVLMGIVDDGE